MFGFADYFVLCFVRNCLKTYTMWPIDISLASFSALCVMIKKFLDPFNFIYRGIDLHINYTPLRGVIRSLNLSNTLPSHRISNFTLNVLFSFWAKYCFYTNKHQVYFIFSKKVDVEISFFVVLFCFDSIKIVYSGAKRVKSIDLYFINNQFQEYLTGCI